MGSCCSAEVPKSPPRPGVPLSVVEEASVIAEDVSQLAKPVEFRAELAKQRLFSGPICETCNGNGCTMCDGIGRKELKQLCSLEKIDVPCMICYADSAYGISTKCRHFYCQHCITSTLNAILETGQFPAMCPQCRVDKEEEGTGLIDQKALTFLCQREVISKEFMSRFLKQTLPNQVVYFLCPKCPHLLIDCDPNYSDEKFTPLRGECPCGASVCCTCHHVWKDCICGKCGQDIDDETFALMRQIGKACPACGQFIQKNEGCDYMMCGTKAHGKLLDALRNGGCGASFFWETMKLNTGHYIECDGKKTEPKKPIGDQRHRIAELRMKGLL